MNEERNRLGEVHDLLDALEEAVKSGSSPEKRAAIADSLVADTRDNGEIVTEVSDGVLFEIMLAVDRANRALKEKRRGHQAESGH